MAKFWTVSAAANGKQATIDVVGEIGRFGAMEESTAAADFMRSLRSLGRVDRLDVMIHSPGGSVWDGLAIYRALREFKATAKVAHVPSICASIATVVALGCDRVEVAPEATWMIHAPVLDGTFNSEQDFDRGKQLFVNARDTILDIYERRTGTDRKKLAEMLDATTWLYGRDIVSAGFADAVKEDKPKLRLAAIAPPKYWAVLPKNMTRPKSTLRHDLAERIRKITGATSKSKLRPDIAKRLAKLKETR